jgi:hypothetical protein
VTAARGAFLAAVLVAAAAVPVSAAGAASTADAAECNGSARLCAMPLGDVAFATTHNSMLLPFEPGDALPTLGEMVGSGKRLLVSLEYSDGGPTLPNAFAGLVEETPFNFLRASDLRAPSSCDPNRGVPGSPVFQLNHWVTPGRRTGSGRVNGELLRTSAARCVEARRRALTLVAVDFAEHGDLLGVVRDLNRGSR